jgi:CelD/BcsL family acetyltransferase involved in cellulose biosynthesis
MQALQLGTLSSARHTLTRRRADDRAWCAFVGSHPQATLFHDPAWAGLLAEVYGYQPILLVLEDPVGWPLAGALFLSIRSRVTGRRLVSLPFTDHSPPLARDEQALHDFTEALVQWRRDHRAPAVEVHAELAELPGVSLVPQGVRHLMPLGCPPDHLYASLKGTQVGRAIRKAERSGVTVRLDRSREAIEHYYRLHCLTRRRQGVPVQPRRFFQRLWSALIAQGQGFVALAEHGGAPVAGAVFLGGHGCLIYKYGASDPASWDLRPNNLLFWKAMEWACGDGYRVLDFGKTELGNSGLRDFKSRWGAEEVPLSFAAVSDRPTEPGDGRAHRMLARVLKSTPPVTGRIVGELLYGHFA